MLEKPILGGKFPEEKKDVRKGGKERKRREGRREGGEEKGKEGKRREEERKEQKGKEWKKEKDGRAKTCPGVIRTCQCFDACPQGTLRSPAQ